MINNSDVIDTDDNDDHGNEMMTMSIIINRLDTISSNPPLLDLGHRYLVSGVKLL